MRTLTLSLQVNSGNLAKGRVVISVNTLTLPSEDVDLIKGLLHSMSKAADTITREMIVEVGRAPASKPSMHLN